MDLKSTITKTDTLKNDLKLAKENINDKIISWGGGTRANTISGVPGKIDEMLGQYKKVAIWQGSERFKPEYYKISTWSKKINCDFKIQRFFIFKMDTDGRGIRLGLDSEDYKTFQRPTQGGDYSGNPVRLSVSNNTVKYELNNEDAYIIDELITKVIAIG